MGPSAHALEALARAAREGNRYQYPETSALVEIAAGIERLRPEHFAVYPGSSLALHHAVIAFTSPTRALVTAEPGYEAAALAAGFIGAKVVRVPLCSDGRTTSRPCSRRRGPSPPASSTSAIRPIRRAP